MKVEIVNVKELIDIEKKLFELYHSFINNYQGLFSKYEGQLVVSECWTLNNKTDFRMLTHPHAYRSYIYWISYQVLDGENQPIIIDEENSWLERSYAVLVVNRKKKSQEIFTAQYYDDMQDVKEELELDIQLLRNLRYGTGDGSL